MKIISIEFELISSVFNYRQTYVKMMFKAYKIHLYYSFLKVTKYRF